MSLFLGASIRSASTSEASYFPALEPLATSRDRGRALPATQHLLTLTQTLTAYVRYSSSGVAQHLIAKDLLGGGYSFDLVMMLDFAGV